MPASGERNGRPAMVRPQDCDGRFTSSGSRSVPRFLRRTDSASKAPRAPDSSPTCPSPPGRGCRSVVGDIPALSGWSGCALSLLTPRQSGTPWCQGLGSCCGLRLCSLSLSSETENGPLTSPPRGGPSGVLLIAAPLPPRSQRDECVCGVCECVWVSVCAWK